MTSWSGMCQQSHKTYRELWKQSSQGSPKKILKYHSICNMNMFQALLTQHPPQSPKPKIVLTKEKQGKHFKMQYKHSRLHKLYLQISQPVPQEKQSTKFKPKWMQSSKQATLELLQWWEPEAHAKCQRQLANTTFSGCICVFLSKWTLWKWRLQTPRLAGT